MPESQFLQGLPALVDGRCRIIVLGSFPGVKSLASQSYYGNPFNHFWELVANARNSPLPPFSDNPARCEWLLGLGIASWDVVGECIRPGSLDQSIRQPRFNDIAGLLARWPGIKRLVLNGGTAARLFDRHIAASLQAIPSVRVPSSSPIPSRDFRRREDKQPAWTAALDSETLP